MKVFTLPWQADAGFDDAEVQAFLEEREVLEVSEHFFVHEKTPALVLIVTYREAGPSLPKRSSTSRSRGKVDKAAVGLSDEEKARYDAIRTWRNQLAPSLGKPNYLLFTNEVAATLARTMPTSKADLAAISGFGNSRVDELGEGLLTFLPTIATAAAPADAGPAGAPPDEKPV